jgi:hypothetical protein
MGIELTGHHHSGLDDAKNISKIVLQLLREGATFSATANTEGKISENLRLTKVNSESSEESYSDFKVHRLEKIIKKKSEDKPQINKVLLIANGGKESEGKWKEITTTNWGIFLKHCTNKVGIKAKRIFLEDGSEVTSVDILKNEQKLYVSAGEDFKTI